MFKTEIAESRAKKEELDIVSEACQPSKEETEQTECAIVKKHGATRMKVKWATVNPV